MDIAVEQISDLTRKLTISLPAETAKPVLEKTYARANKGLHLKGFRPGKVPRQFLEKNFKQDIEAEAAEQLVQESYFQAIEEQQFKPVVQPEISEFHFLDDGSFSYIALVDLKPEFELGQYKGLEIEMPPLVLSELDIDLELQHIRRKQAAIQTAPEGHAIAVDDIVTIDFQGFHEGKTLRGLHKENYTLDIGSNRLGAEFEQKILGLHQGDKTSYEVDFAPTFPDSLVAGKKIEFKVDVKLVKVRVLPELDDELAKDVDDSFTTLDDLKNAIRADLTKAKEKAREGEINEKILLRLVEQCKFEAPKRLVDFEVAAQMHELESGLKRQGMSFEAAGVNTQKIAENSREGAEKRVKSDFILKKIADEEKLKLSEEDMEQGYKRIAVRYHISPEEAREAFRSKEELLPLINELLNKKVLDFLREQTKIIDTAPDSGTVREPANPAPVA